MKKEKFFEALGVLQALAVVGIIILFACGVFNDTLDHIIGCVVKFIIGLF